MGICSKSFYKHWILFPTVWFYRDCPRGVPRGKQNVVKMRSFTSWGLLKSITRHRYIAISQKWLKIDGHMQQGVWPALNSLSIHVTFTAIVPGAYPREAKMCKNVLKWRTFELTGWITIGDNTVIIVSYSPMNQQNTSKQSAVPVAIYRGQVKQEGGSWDGTVEGWWTGGTFWA